MANFDPVARNPRSVNVFQFIPNKKSVLENRSKIFVVWAIKIMKCQ